MINLKCVDVSLMRDRFCQRLFARGISRNRCIRRQRSDAHHLGDGTLHLAIPNLDLHKIFGRRDAMKRLSGLTSRWTIPLA